MSSGNTLPTQLRELLARLEYISMAKRGRKMNLHAGTYIDPPSIFSPASWISWAQRKISLESREMAVREVLTAIDEAINSLANFPTYSHVIKTALERAMDGIEALEQTYYDHPRTLAQLRIARMQVEMTIR